MPRQIVRTAFVAFVFGVLLAPMANAQITEYETDASGWLSSVGEEPGLDLDAFDRYYPGVAGLANLSGSVVSITLRGNGRMTVSRLDQWHQPTGYALVDGTSVYGQASDAVLFYATYPALMLEFDPPITAFYTYYGSLEANRTVTMALYSAGQYVGAVSRNTGSYSILARGHGFVNSEPIDRIDFTLTWDAYQGCTVGAFCGLVEGESSLGTEYIEDYVGPNGENVERDFACVFVTCVGDANCDGQVSFADINPFGQMLSDLESWRETYPGCPVRNGDINADGEVDFGDLNPFTTLLSTHQLPILCPY